jgi:hypothetical protein
MFAGTFALTPATPMKAPVYFTALPFAKPIMPNPTIAMIELKIKTGARDLYLSPYQEVVYMRIAANTYGGATKHWDAATLNPMLSLKMMGKKKANEYVTVVVQLGSVR